MVSSSGNEFRELLDEQARLESEVDIMDGILRYRIANGLYGSRRGVYEHHARVLRQSRARLAGAREKVLGWRLTHPI